MIELIDKSKDIWSWCCPHDIERVCYEDGTSVDLSPKLILINRGKYAGTLLSELSDVWYLKFLLKISTEEEDIFLEKCVRMRLLELR